MRSGTDERRDGSGAVGFLLSRQFVGLWAFMMGVYVLGWATKWTFDPTTIGKFWPGHFYSAQADALLHGRLWIDEQWLPGECSYAGGRCYGYFGIVPSLLRIPLVLLFGIESSELTPLFLAVAAGIAMWASLDLCRRVLTREDPAGGRFAGWYMAIAAVVLGPGSVLVLLTDPYVYQEAILWMIAGLLIGTSLLWRWWSEQRRWQFVGAVIAFVFAAGARPTAMFVGVVLASGVAASRWIAYRFTWRVAVGSLALALLPFAFAGGVLYAKFGALSSPMSNYEQRDNANLKMIAKIVGDDKTMHIRYVPTAMFMFLRPDAVRLSTDWPWVRIRFGWPYGNHPFERITFLPPLPKDSMYVERTTSITDTMPLAVAATVAVAGVAIVRRRRPYELLMLVGLSTPILATAMSYGITARYLGDAYPLLAVGTAFGAALVPRYARARRSSRVAIAVPVLALTPVSVVVAASLATQYDWIHYLGTQ